MYTDEQFEKLEEEERELTLEAIAVMLLLLADTHSRLEKELRAFYQKYGKDGVVTYAQARKWVGVKDHRRRLNVLLSFITDEFNIAFVGLDPRFKAFLTEVVEKELGFFGITLTDEAVEKILKAKWGADELNWLTRLQKDCDLWSVNISKDVKQALLRRDDIETLVTKLDKRFKSINSVLETLGISESTAIGSIARKEVFKDLGVGEYQFYTRADERTCEICGGMHGLIFPMSAYEIGVTASPLHPRCRCWEVPILE